jgi:hypothetical protein
MPSRGIASLNAMLFIVNFESKLPEIIGSVEYSELILKNVVLFMATFEKMNSIIVLELLMSVIFVSFITIFETNALIKCCWWCIEVEFIISKLTSISWNPYLVGEMSNNCSFCNRYCLNSELKNHKSDH